MYPMASSQASQSKAAVRKNPNGNEDATDRRSLQSQISDTLLTSVRSLQPEDLAMSGPASPLASPRPLPKSRSSRRSVRWGNHDIPNDDATNDATNDTTNDTTTNSNNHLSASFSTTDGTETASSSMSVSSPRKGVLKKKKSNSNISRRQVQGMESDTLLPPTTGAALDAVYFHARVEAQIRHLQATFRKRQALRLLRSSRTLEDSSSSSRTELADGESGLGWADDSTRQDPDDEQDEEDEEEEEKPDRSALYMYAFVAVFGFCFIVFKQILKCVNRFRGRHNENGDDDAAADFAQQVGEELTDEAGVQVIQGATHTGGGGGGAGGGAGGAGAAAPPTTPSP
jgi:hypothetical protein